MDLRAIQKPLKEKYRSDPTSSLITLKAHGNQNDSPIACSIEVGQKLIEAQAHAGVGGAGTAACSGDLLLGALAACAQPTCSGGDGCTYRENPCRGGRKDGSTWHSGDFQGRAGWIQRNSHSIRYKGAGGYAGATGCIKRENRTILRCHANPGSTSRNEYELDLDIGR